MATENKSSNSTASSPRDELTLKPFRGKTPYKFIKKIQEDEEFQTWLAEDSSLGRSVHLIVLQPGLDQDRSRRLLLKARKLGQLHHPGILPLYDMGSIQETFYFVRRIPPGPSLLEKWVPEGKAFTKQMKSKGFRLQILTRVAEAMAYAHEAGMSFGKIDFSSIVVGEHGEVLIEDWRHARFNEKKGQKTLPEAWVQDDLKNLARLGMHLLRPQEKDIDYTIVEWDKRARSLPGDLQLILDRAYVKRPEPYGSVEDFNVDMHKYLGGYPLDMQKGDVLASIGGVYRRNKWAVHLITLFFIIGLGSIWPILKKYKELDKEVSALGHRITFLNAEIANQRSQIQSSQEKVDESQQDLNGLDQRSKEVLAELETNSEALSSVKAKVDLAKMSGGDSGQKVLDQRNEIDRLQKKVDDLKAQMSSEALEIRMREMKTKAASMYRRNSSAIDQVMSKFSDYNETQSDEINQWLASNITEEWVTDFLKSRILKTPNRLKALSSKIKSVEDVAISGDNEYIAWIEEGKIIEMESDGTINRYNHEEVKISKLVYSEDDSVLHAVSGKNRAVQLTLDRIESTLEVKHYYWKPTSYGPPIPFAPSNRFTSIDLKKGKRSRMTLRDEEKPNVRQKDLPFKQSLNQIVYLPDGSRAIALDKSGAVHNFQLGNLEIEKTLDKEEYQSIGWIAQNEWVFLQGSEKVYFYDTDLRTLQYECSFSGSIKRIIGEPESMRVWVQEENGDVYALDLTATIQEKKKVMNLNGRILQMTEEGLLVFEDGQFLFCSVENEIPEDQARLLFSSSSENYVGKNAIPLLNQKEVLLDHIILDAHRPLKDQPYVILLHGPRNIELWNLEEGKRVWQQNTHDLQLQKIRLDLKKNRLLVQDDQGRTLVL